MQTSDNSKFKRTMVFLPPTLRENLELAAKKAGKPMGAIAREAIEAHLRTAYNLSPELSPTVDVEVRYRYN